MYLIPQLYRITSSTSHVSVSRLYHALQAVIKRHNILRTALYLDNNGTIMQHCSDTTATNDTMKSYGFSVINLCNDDDIDKNMNDIVNNPDLFDLAEGRVIRCHILRHCRRNDDLSFENDDLLSKDDLILFCMHHSAFDGTSTSIFFRDLSLAYESNDWLPMNDNTLQYIDYAVHERLMDMTSSRQFWHSQLSRYNFQRSLSLPTDRHRSSSDQRSGLAFVTQISFNNDISTAFLNYASSHRLTPFQLGLAIFYAFLFKLTHGERDLCITSLNANRYRTELHDMIGMFDFTNMPSNMNQLSFNGANCEQVPLWKSSQVAVFDFMARFLYNPTVNDEELSCCLVCSRDLFDLVTVVTIARRFQNFVVQLFSSNIDAARINHFTTSINKFAVILPEEAEERQKIVFHRLPSVINEGIYVFYCF
jgi:hypothetical protein